LGSAAESPARFPNSCSRRDAWVPRSASPVQKFRVWVGFHLPEMHSSRLRKNYFRGIILSVAKDLLCFQSSQTADPSLLHPRNGKCRHCRGPGLPPQQASSGLADDTRGFRNLPVGFVSHPGKLTAVCFLLLFSSKLKC
jgi:hypothetical protein